MHRTHRLDIEREARAPYRASADRPWARAPSRLTSNCAMAVPCGVANGTSKLQRCAASARGRSGCSGSDATCSRVWRASAPSVRGDQPLGDLMRRGVRRDRGRRRRLRGKRRAAIGRRQEFGLAAAGRDGASRGASAVASVLARFVACSGDNGRVRLQGNSDREFGGRPGETLSHMRDGLTRPAQAAPARDRRLGLALARGQAGSQPAAAVPARSRTRSAAPGGTPAARP